MRKIIAAIQMSVDGAIEGRQGELDWAMAEDDDTWGELSAMLEHTDAFLLGRIMYPAYEKYWRDALANPERFTKSEVAYARFADRTPHFVVSRTLRSVDWKAARVIADVEEIRKMKHEAGKDIQIVGGAKLISSLFNLGLVDELRLTVNPLLLPGGKALFGGVTDRRALKLRSAKALRSGKVVLTYDT